MQLQGTATVVTGASQGIGRATTVRLCARGAQVLAVARDGAALADVAAACGAMPFVADVADPDHADRVVAAAIDAFGRLDVVVANAGIGHEGAVVDMTPERIVELIDVNVRAPLLLARAALPHLVRQGRGALVFVTSIAGALLVPNESVYSATKAAVEAFAEPLREELRGTGVTVSTVLPGVVATEFFDRRGAPYVRSRPRPIPADRVAAAVVRAAESGTPRIVVPGWFAGPIRLRGLAPGLFRAMSRRFG